jgi:hypothetical protein
MSKQFRLLGQAFVAGASFRELDIEAFEDVGRLAQHRPESQAGFGTTLPPRTPV